VSTAAISNPACIYPESNPTSLPIQVAINAIVSNRSKCTSFYLDTLQSQSSGGENHHQGLARTHRLSDGSIYFFLTHSNLDSGGKGNLMQFRYAGPTDHEHVLRTSPLTVAPLKQLLKLQEQHPSDLVFLPDVNHLDAGYLFVTEEYDEFRVNIYRWEPSTNFALLGDITQRFRQFGPAFVFLDKVGNFYYLGIATNHDPQQVRICSAHAHELFPKCEKGSLNVSAFQPLAPQSMFPFPVSGGPSQVKLIRDSTGHWYLLAFVSEPNDDPNGDDYIDVYPVTFSPFSIAPRLSHTHIFFPSGDTGFASTGTHYVEKSGRLLVSSSYRWSNDEGPGSSSYVSRVDECPSS
jgi:hypothetical protein